MLQSASSVSAPDLKENYLVAYGGQMNTGQFTDQIIAVNLEEIGWEEVEARKYTEVQADFFLMGAQIVPFYYKEREILDLFSKSEILWDRVRHLIKEEGVFMCGGMKQDGTLNEEFFLL